MPDPRLELRQLRASWEYAYASAGGCHACGPGLKSGADDPRLEWVFQRERELIEQIRAMGGA